MMTAATTPSDRPRADFGRKRRIRSRQDFEAAHRTGRRHHAGPLVVILRTRDAGECAADTPARLGLAVSRRAGHAPRRNLIKRRLREAFRTRRSEFPSAVDIVISVRPHDPISVDDYGRLIERAVRGLTNRLTDER